MEHKIIKDDRGAAIITVIVVSAFITIIATTMLYIAGRNYMSKQTDYQNKISFYQAEEVLDKLKAYLVEDVSDAFEYAYADTMANYVDHKGTPNVESYYARSYTEKLKKIWTDRETAAISTDPEVSKLTQAVRDYLVSKLMEDGMEEEAAKAIAERIRSVDRCEIPPAKDKFIFVGVRVAYEPEDGYSTYIYTDIGLELPDFYMQGMPDADERGGQTLELADCVKYMNWKRYDD